MARGRAWHDWQRTAFVAAAILNSNRVKGEPIQPWQLLPEEMQEELTDEHLRDRIDSQTL